MDAEMLDVMMDPEAEAETAAAAEGVATAAAAGVVTAGAGSSARESLRSVACSCG